MGCNNYYLFGVLSAGIVATRLVASGANEPVDYLLGPADQILVHVTDLDEIPDRPVKIDSRGDIELPVAGHLHAEGLTTGSLGVVIADRLRIYLKEPHVTVSLADLRDEPVTVLGAVNQPGVKQVREPKRLYQIISEAGGLKSNAGAAIRIARPKGNGPLPLNGAHPDSTGDYQIGEVSVASVIGSQNPSDNIPIFPHDVITVPGAQTVHVLGEVLHPGTYEIGESSTISILDALAKAGGPLHNGLISRARVLRPVPGSGERVEQNVDLNRILSGKAKDYSLSGEDILYIPTNRGKVVATRAIEAMIGTGSAITAFRGSR